jgi:adenine phosphoribosyltransferase
VAGWRDLIRDVPDFPRKGVVFKDLTPLLADADGFAAAIDAIGSAVARERDAVLAADWLPAGLVDAGRR